MICSFCSKGGTMYEFCWYCLHQWFGSGIKDCGNADCNGEDPRLKILKDSPTKSVVGVKCPSRRACPKCGMLIEHEKACKQMVCRCGQKFCFICLKVASSTGRYQCGSFNSKCTPAPVQSTIPGA